MQKQFMGVAALGAALAIGDASHAQAVQWRIDDGGNGHWYQVTTTDFANWSSAKLAAEADGAHLATISTEGEWNFVRPRALGCYLGGYQDSTHPDWSEPTGGWRWITGEAWAVGPWAGFGPDDAPCHVNNGDGQQDVLWLAFQSGGIIDDIEANPVSYCPNSLEKPAVFEWSADCNNDGIVDYGQCRDGSLPDYNGNNVPDCCEQGTPCMVANYPFQWRVGEGGNGHWYAVYPCTTGLSAQAIADAVQGHLVSITSAIENEFIRRQVVASGRQFAMLGLVQADNQSSPSVGWAWTSGEALSYVNWTDFGGAYGFVAPDDRPCAGPTPQEDNQCNQGLMYAVDGSWDDIERGPSCAGFASSSVAVVEFDTDCNRDGIVDKGQILTDQLADSDNDGVPNVCECICDVFRDFNVNGIDLGILLGQWGAGTQFTVTDFNNDGVVDGIDLGQLLAAWGPCPD